MVIGSSSDSSSGSDSNFLKAEFERLFGKKGLPIQPLDWIEPRDPSTRKPPPPLGPEDMVSEQPQASTSGSEGSAREPETACPFARFFKDRASYDHFRMTYDIPEGVDVEMGPKSMEALPGSYAEGTLVIPIMAIVEGGVRFPIHPLLRRVLNALNLTTSQLSVNSYRVIMSLVALREEFPLITFGINELFETFYVGWNKKTNVRYLASRPKYTELLIEKLPEKDEWGSVFVVASGPNLFPPNERTPVRWNEGVYDLGAVELYRQPHDPKVIEAAYALPAELRSAPRLLGYKPTYKAFLKKKKKKGAKASSSQASKLPGPSTAPSEMAPKRAQGPIDLTVRPRSKTASGKGPCPGGSEQGAPRMKNVGVKPTAGPREKRSREEPSGSSGGQGKKPSREREEVPRKPSTEREEAQKEPTSQADADKSSQHQIEPSAWVPKVVTDKGRQVHAEDTALANAGVAVAVARSVILPRDKREMLSEGPNIFARHCQDAYKMMARGLVFERQHEDALGKIDALKGRLMDVGAERNAAKAELAEKAAALTEKALALESRELEFATTASALEAEKREVAKLKTLVEAAEQKYFDQGYDEAEKEYSRQVEVVRGQEFGDGARFGYDCAHREILCSRGIFPGSAEFTWPEPRPEYLVRQRTPPSSPEQEDEPSGTPPSSLLAPITQDPPVQGSPPPVE